MVLLICLPATLGPVLAASLVTGDQPMSSVPDFVPCGQAAEKRQRGKGNCSAPWPLASLTSHVTSLVFHGLPVCLFSI